jgi:hypothetical protein
MNDGESGVSLVDVSVQLRSYGRWLEDRSNVELAADDVDLLADLDGGGPGPSRRPRVLAGIAAAGALIVVVVAGLGLGSRSSGDGEQLEAGPAALGGVTVETPPGDHPTSETEGRERPAVGTDGDQLGVGALPAAAAPGAAGTDGGSAESGTGDEAAAPGPGTGTPADQVADDPAGSSDESASDIAMTPSTVELDENNTPLTPAAEGSAAFVSPANGATIDLNAMNTLRARPVDGATTYVFEGWQNGASVMSASMVEPVLVLPSRMISTGITSQVRPGPMQLTVSARDAAGTVVGSGQIDVMVAGSGGVAGQDVIGDSPFPTNP